MQGGYHHCRPGIASSHLRRSDRETRQASALPRFWYTCKMLKRTSGYFFREFSFSFERVCKKYLARGPSGAESFRNNINAQAFVFHAGNSQDTEREPKATVQRRREGVAPPKYRAFASILHRGTHKKQSKRCKQRFDETATYFNQGMAGSAYRGNRSVAKNWLVPKTA